MYYICTVNQLLHSYRPLQLPLSRVSGGNAMFDDEMIIS
jgi:hypothetical protein